MLIERNPYMQILFDFKNKHIIKLISGVHFCDKSIMLGTFADKL
jgi:hypothetical protein